MDPVADSAGHSKEGHRKCASIVPTSVRIPAIKAACGLRAGALSTGQSARIAMARRHSAGAMTTVAKANA